MDGESAAERIEEALDEPTSFEFGQQPSTMPSEYVAQLHEITILIDEVALNDIGVPTDEPVNLVLTGVSLAERATDPRRGPFDLDTLIEDEVMVTPEETGRGAAGGAGVQSGPAGEGVPETLVQILETSIPGTT